MWRKTFLVDYFLTWTPYWTVYLNVVETNDKIVAALTTFQTCKIRVLQTTVCCFGFWYVFKCIQPKKTFTSCTATHLNVASNIFWIFSHNINKQYTFSPKSFLLLDGQQAHWLWNKSMSSCICKVGIVSWRSDVQTNIFLICGSFGGSVRRKVKGSRNPSWSPSGKIISTANLKHSKCSRVSDIILHVRPSSLNLQPLKQAMWQKKQIFEFSAESGHRSSFTIWPKVPLLLLSASQSDTDL